MAAPPGGQGLKERFVRVAFNVEGVLTKGSSGLKGEVGRGEDRRIHGIIGEWNRLVSEQQAPQVDVLNWVAELVPRGSDALDESSIEEVLRIRVISSAMPEYVL